MKHEVVVAKPPVEPGLSEIRLKYLRGEISWETYRVYEKSLTVQFGNRKPGERSAAPISDREQPKKVMAVAG